MTTSRYTGAASFARPFEHVHNVEEGIRKFAAWRRNFYNA
jgi:hypothetical protein